MKTQFKPEIKLTITNSLRVILLLLITSSIVALLVSLHLISLITILVDEIETNFVRELHSTSSQGAKLATPEELSQYRTPEDMNLPSYQELRHKLRQFAAETGVQYAYYLRVEDGRLQFIVDNDFEEATRVGLDTPPTDVSLVPGLAAALEGQLSASMLGNYMAGWEGLFSGYAPIFDGEGRVVAVCGVDIDDTKVVETRNLFFRLWVSQLASVTILLGSSICCFALYRRESVRANYDALTGIHNRRFLENRITGLMKVLSRSKGDLTMMMADIDFFKKYNDGYGHKQGDECLRAVAGALSACAARQGDCVIRFGGEEFLLVLPNTDENGAKALAEKLLHSVRELNYSHNYSTVASRVTVSVGVATGKVAHTQKWEDYLRRADEAMYISKQNGRNRYTFLSMGRGSGEGQAFPVSIGIFRRR